MKTKWEKQSYLSKLARAKESATITPILAETQKPGEEFWGGGRKVREDLRYVLTEGYWHQEAAGRLSRSRVSYVIGVYLAFSA